MMSLKGVVMNYLGKYGKPHEVPFIIKRYCFSKNGEKLLLPVGPFGFRIKNPTLLNVEKNEFYIVFERAIREMEANIGANSNYGSASLNGDEFTFQILDPIALILEKMNITLKEALLINDSVSFRKECNIRQLLTDYYDSDTDVEIYSKDNELFIKEKAKNILLLNSLCNCGIAEYFDDCYSNHSVAITPTGMVKTAVYNEIDIKRQLMN